MVITYTVPKVDTTTMVTADPATSAQGQSVTYAATVAAASGTADRPGR